MRKARRAFGFDALESRVALSGATIVRTDLYTQILTPSGNGMAHFVKNGPADGGGASFYYEADGTQIVVTPSGNYNINVQK